MKAVVLTADRTVAVADVPVPQPGPSQVLVRVAYCGICGTDLHASQNAAFLPPVIMGHEFSGEIAAVGADVQGWRVGQSVVANPNGFICGECPACRAGRYNLCPIATKRRALGVAVDGGMAEYVALDPSYLVAVPESLDAVETAWTEPLGVAVRAVRTSPVRLGSRVAVIGAGPIGQLIIQVARLAGAESVTAVEMSAYRRSLALTSGAVAALTPEEAGNLAGSDDPFDVVFECSGAAPALTLAIRLLRAGGAVRMVGMPPGDARFDAVTTIMNEIDILTGFIYTPDEFRQGLTLLAEHRINTESLTSRVMPLTDIDAAFAALKDPESTMKVLLKA